MENDEGNLFEVLVLVNNSVRHYYSKQVNIASGEMNEKKIPAFAKNISSDTKQLHTTEYRSAHQLPDGAVLVVGGATSGCQVAEDLANAGRKVYLSTSMVARVPRRYRGRDIMDWLLESKFFDVRKEDITDPVMLNMKAPQMKGSANGAETLSLQALAKKGVTIVGKLASAEKEDLLFQPNAAMHVKFADQFSGNVKNMIDEFIAKTGVQAPARDFDEADVPDAEAACAAQITSLNLQENNISSIIWTTGFGCDFTYLKLPVFDSEGNLKHHDGISDVEGLYFLGFAWLRCRKSQLIHGAKDDAKFIAEKVYNYSSKQMATPLLEVQ
jgi:putative flavoprotein involved in K+ transport